VCLIRDRKCLPFPSTWVHPWFLVCSVVLRYLVFCVVLCFFVFFVFVLCLMWEMLPVSLDCLFWIAPSIISNFYFSWIIYTNQIYVSICDVKHFYDDFNLLSIVYICDDKKFFRRLRLCDNNEILRRLHSVVYVTIKNTYND